MAKFAGSSHFNWLEEESVKAITIVGICKNAGKTTLLNHLISFKKKGTWGVFSTGIDGEETDFLFRIPKPPVILDKDFIFCCDTSTLDELGCQIVVLSKLPFSVDRPLWLAKTLIPLQTEITGPSTVKEQIQTLKLIQNYGAEKVLIDGSIDRKSIAQSEYIDAVIMVIGANFGTLDEITDEVNRLKILNSIPQCTMVTPNSPEYKFLLDSEEICLYEERNWKPSGLVSLIGNIKPLRQMISKSTEAIYIPGAITDMVYQDIKNILSQSGAQLIVRHPNCLKIRLKRLEFFYTQHHPTALIPFRIRNWALNSMGLGFSDIEAQEFRAYLRAQFPDLNFVDVMELGYE
ncbi:MAG TPA: hypothetical protein PK577_02110 [Candidatus Syntrophosphaera thermopropionivorans]|nr:hypothetical protein [Candidatus Syntrophosphaera thermopropionivorans]